jgi:hypothetical protein
MSRWRKLFVAAGFELAAIALVFAVWAFSEGGARIRARMVLTWFMLAVSMVAVFAPLWAATDCVGRGYRRSLAVVLEPPGWTLAVTLSGPLLLALFFDRGALAAWLLAVVTCAAAALASAALVLALARLTRRPLASVGLAAVLLLAFSLQPLYTKKLIRAARGRPGVQRLLIDAGVRAPWMAAAYAMKRARRTDPPWSYDPITSNSLYNRWVGTDLVVIIPGPGRYILEYLGFALILAALAGLREAPVPAKEDPDVAADGPPDGGAAGA